MDSHFRKLENMYHSAPVNRLILNKLVVFDGRAELRWEVDPDFFHAANALHGSLYFKLLDDAAFFASSSIEKDFFVLTASYNIHFLRPVAGGSLLAEGRVVAPGKQKIIAESVLKNEKGKEVARGSGIFMRSTYRLDDVPGYR